MKKNYSDLIKDKKNRTLTAKGYKFLSKCIDIAAEQRGLTRYHKEIKPIREQLRAILTHLIVDLEYSTAEIKKVVQTSLKKDLKIN